MRTLIVLVICVWALLAGCVSPVFEAYPTPDKAPEISVLRGSPHARVGEILAIRGRIDALREISSKPVLLVIVDEREPVWIGWLYESLSVEVGDMVRVLGFRVPEDFYFSEVDSTTDGVHVLAFAIVNERSNTMSFDPQHSRKQIEDWAAGEVPETR